MKYCIFRDFSIILKRLWSDVLYFGNKSRTRTNLERIYWVPLETVIKIFSSNRPELFTKLGKDLRIRCMKIKYWLEEAAKQIYRLDEEIPESFA